MQQSFDSRNADIQVWIGDRLWPREQAKVSVFDSVVQGGDAVWEGLRVYHGRIAFLAEHIKRLQDSAKALAFADIPEPNAVRAAISATLKANGMHDGAHIRLTLTRGEKITSGMDPRLNQSGCCLIVLAEWKPPVYESAGIKLITASTRRNSPATLDSKIHHNNLLNNILAKIEANVAGADDALMLDLSGFVSETNATNVFVVRGNELLTPRSTACLPGITRAVVMQLAGDHHIPCREADLSLTEIYTADEMFVTGTMGELAPVLAVDGRVIGDGEIGSLTQRLAQLYVERAAQSGEPVS